MTECLSTYTQVWSWAWEFDSQQVPRSCWRCYLSRGLYFESHCFRIKDSGSPSCFPTRISREALKIYVNAWTLLQKDSVIVGKDCFCFFFFNCSPGDCNVESHSNKGWRQLFQGRGQQTGSSSWLLFLQINLIGTQPGAFVSLRSVADSSVRTELSSRDRDHWPAEELLLLLSCSVVSDSVRPHGQQPTRLLHPQDSPSKNTGVGCHHLLWPAEQNKLILF